MHAQPGDRLVVESPATGATRRDGEIVALHHEDGTPPYDVRWSDTGEVTLVFPGPDAHIDHLSGPDDAPAPPSAHGSSGAPPAEARPGRPGDIGRRLTAARERCGLSVEETADRARMSPQYLAYLEEYPSDPNPATLLRLADVLGTTLDALRGGGQDLPPGQGYALLRPELRDLGPEECRELLSTHGVGRLALSTSRGPAVFPVNYDVVDGDLVFRTAPGSAPAEAAGAEAAFEVDHIDDAMSRGWSVLAVGRGEAVTDPDAVRRLEERARSTPWAGGPRDLWIRIRPERLTGRRITPRQD
ncbi:XRE family transcriptional regulator [Streptomyces sp. SAT1]|uniref:pyridoxamine 5'-phosphate oxidase family protein n=1 Tax=unclassified Streptomyces TaxID=2593676 RepID=UPI0007DE05E8|nr:pyridoxamine 5'-phosphate oxidase family protein [Streptomyces sp. SAT1]ANH94128.1 XRE family transcriptional regulator [Streptomyces sp. SAT1]